MTGAERNPRKKIRISIIDILIVLVIAACIVGTFIHYRVYEKNNEVVTDDNSLISVLYSSLTPEVAERAVVGDMVFFDSGEALGRIVEVVVEDAEVYHKDTDGKWVIGTDTTKKDVTVTLQVEGDFTEGGFLANGTKYVAAGMEIEVYTPKFSGKGLIFEVKKQAE
ncbi:MAG: DUF4330 family protein [Clostridia bacterium]|nr:DUF4330 family protein [Clostridia bacterium]